MSYYPYNAATDTTVSPVAITAADASSTTATGPYNQSIISGSPTANSAASFTLSGQAALMVQVTGTWSASIQSEVSFDSGTTWYKRQVRIIGTSNSLSATTANFGGVINVAGCTNYRVRCTAFSSGTANVGFTETAHEGAVDVGNANEINPVATLSKFVTDSNGGALTANTAYTASLTVSGFAAVELEITSLTGSATIYYTLDGSTPSATNYTGVLPASVCSVTLPCNGTPTLKLISTASQSITAVVRGS